MIELHSSFQKTTVFKDFLNPKKARCLLNVVQVYCRIVSS